MNKLKHFIKGIAIGGTMMVPGVSGGTMALILGIYDEIIHSISSFFKDIKKNFLFFAISRCEISWQQKSPGRARPEPLSAVFASNYSKIFATVPAPTVWPPSRIAN